MSSAGGTLSSSTTREGKSTHPWGRVQGGNNAPGRPLVRSCWGLDWWSPRMRWDSCYLLLGAPKVAGVEGAEGRAAYLGSAEAFVASAPRRWTLRVAPTVHARKNNRNHSRRVSATSGRNWRARLNIARGRRVMGPDFKTATRSTIDVSTSLRPAWPAPCLTIDPSVYLEETRDVLRRLATRLVR